MNKKKGKAINNGRHNMAYIPRMSTFIAMSSSFITPSILVASVVIFSCLSNTLCKIRLLPDMITCKIISPIKGYKSGIPVSCSSCNKNVDITFSVYDVDIIFSVYDIYITFSVYDVDITFSVYDVDITFSVYDVDITFSLYDAFLE